MAITISTYGQRDNTEEAIASSFGDADVVVVEKSGERKEEKAEGTKEEATPEEKKEEKEQKPPEEKQAAAKGKEKDDDGFPDEAVQQIAKLRKQRRDARDEAQELREENERLKKAGQDRGTATAEVVDNNRTYSSKPEPKIEDFQADPEKYPDPYAAFTTAYGRWSRDEAKAELRAEQEATERDEAAQGRVEHFEETRAKLEEHFPDLDEVISSDEARSVMLHSVIVDAVRESEVGPAVLRHLILNPDIAKSWLKKTPALQLVALGRLETAIEKELEAKVPAKADGKKDDKKDDKKAEATPPAKTKSNAPAPVEHLKASGESTANDFKGNGAMQVSVLNADLAAYEKKRRAEGYVP